MTTHLDGDRLYRGDGKTIEITVKRFSGSLVGAEIKFLLMLELTPNQLVPLASLSRSAESVEIVDESPSLLIARFTIPGAATDPTAIAQPEVAAAIASIPLPGRTLIWDCKIIPLGGSPTTLRGVLRLVPDLRVVTP